MYFFKWFAHLRDKILHVPQEVTYLLSCIYNNIVMEGGDRQLWEVIGFDYDEEDTDIFHCIDTIRNGDIDSTDLRVLYRLISTTDGAFKAKMKETIVTRLNQISDKDCKENK